MGAYLSEPLTEKDSSNQSNGSLSSGASSMQGWRVMQEDAHNSILDYDTDTSFFAVYDGHGGAEVAKYCAQKLPQHIKDTEAYRNGDFSQALEDAFLGFDATIADPEIIKLLKTLATTDEGSDEEENVHNLCEEARMPLEEVIAKYQNKVNTIVSHLKAESCSSSKHFSLKLRSRKNIVSDGACSSSSKNFDDSEPVSSSSTSNFKNIDGDNSETQVSTSNGLHKQPESPLPGISSTDEFESSKKSEINESSPKSSVDCISVPESSQPDNKKVPESTSNEVETSDIKNNVEINNIQTTNESSNCDDKENKSNSSSRLLKKRPPGFYNTLLGAFSEDDDDSDSNDETFEGKECGSSSDDDNPVNGVNGDSSEDDDVDEEDSSDGEIDEDDEEMDNFSLKIKNEPGSNSGCTAVVALLHKDQLYVANAGDSRCVVCRNGKAIDMSIDHKPEDEPELQRILKAGGKVSKDGRVNGGLNLSRAIGDLGYKQNKELGPKEQMITALPDIKTLTIVPETDNFMVLACDGIWNFMTSQNVVDFVSERLAEGREKLSQICEEMFDHCLAPNTTGDGTGCDNMTAVIIKFDSLPKSATFSEGSKKRPSDEKQLDEEIDAKRLKTDNDAVDVTSSV